MANAKQKLKAWALLVLGVLLIAGTPIWTARGVLQILRENRIWKTGTIAANARVRGGEHRTGFFRSYDAEVSYQDTQGHSQRHSYTLHSVWTLAYINYPPTVKYDPEVPSSFATSLSQQLGWGQWAYCVLALVGGCTMGVVFWVFGRWNLRATRAGQSQRA